MARSRLRRRLPDPARPSAHTEIPWAVVLAIVVAALALALAVRARRRSLVCRANLTRMVVALKLYANDHDGLCPPHDEWPAHLESALTTPVCYDCPAMRGRGPDYEYHRAQAGSELAEVDSPGNAWVFWDAYLRTGEPVHPHTWGVNAAYCDGHVGHVPREHLQDHVCP